jgi:hypothetical protein
MWTFVGTVEERITDQELELWSREDAIASGGDMEVRSRCLGSWNLKSGPRSFQELPRNLQTHWKGMLAFPREYRILRKPCQLGGGGHSSDNLSWFKITLKIECTRKLRNNQAKNIFNEDFWEKKKFKHMFTRSLSA